VQIVQPYIASLILNRKAIALPDIFLPSVADYKLSFHLPVKRHYEVVLAQMQSLEKAAVAASAQKNLPIFSEMPPKFLKTIL
jgi:hypothetical protein